jgi:hypothetical protein
MSQYTYPITDFLNDKVDSTKLTYEITNSTISGVLSYINADENYCDIFFVTDLSAADQITLSGVVVNHDGAPLEGYYGNLDYFLDERAIVVDSYTNISGSFLPMQVLVHRRDLYNDNENPLYLAGGFTPILGASGILQDHADRVLNLENIHAKVGGWHREEVKKAAYEKPLNLLIYYGWLNSFNSATLGWNNEAVAKEMANYNILVFGAGLEDPAHGDYANTIIIIPRVKALNPNCKIFGYVTTNQSLNDFQTKATRWNTLQVDGIFMDESGYDYGTVPTNGRDAFNTKVTYVHGLSYANTCFVNSWNMDHIIGTTNDVSYPNSTWNTASGASTLTEDDYYLLESFGINTTAYAGTNGYEPKADWLARGELAVSNRYIYGINLIGCGIINNDNANAQKLFNFGYISAAMFALEGWGTSDTSYASGSAAVRFWYRQNTKGLSLWDTAPSVLVDNGDADVYWRYSTGGKLQLDFSSGAELSRIQNFAESGLGVEFVSFGNTTTLTNSPLADREILGQTSWRVKVDLSGFTQFRCTMNVQTAGTVNADVRFQGSVNGGGFVNLDGADGPEIAIGSTGAKDTGWVTLAPAYRTDSVSIRMMEKDGDGAADPIIRQVILMFRP